MNDKLRLLQSILESHGFFKVSVSESAISFESETHRIMIEPTIDGDEGYEAASFFIWSQEHNQGKPANF